MPEDPSVEKNPNEAVPGDEPSASTRRSDESTLLLPGSNGAEAGSGSDTPAEEHKRDTSRLFPGESLAGRFTIRRFIARGGMGAVYEAEDGLLKTRVALKVIGGRLAVEASELERFRREVLLSRRVGHPNVCRVYEFYQATTAAGVPIQFLTMEFLEGETLAERIKQTGPLTTVEMLPLVRQMCEGLAAAHAEGVIHRDFKCSNVLLVPKAMTSGKSTTEEMRVVITDFGVARALDAERATERLSGGAGILGTPDYMAPEQVTGGEVTRATDIYALGVVIFEMVTGKLPFTAKTPLASAARRLNEAPPRPEVAAPGLEKRWAATISRCMAREPERRFSRAQDVIAALELPPRPRRLGLAGGRKVLESDAALGEAAQRQLARRWGWAVAGVLVALSLGVAAYFIGRGSRPPLPSVVQMTFRRGAVSVGRFSPDGRLVYSAAWGSEPEQIYTGALGSMEAQSLGLTSARLLSVSATGELAVLLRPIWFGYSVLGTLALVPVGGGTPRPVVENACFADWSSTGELAVVRAKNGHHLEYPLGTTLFDSLGFIVYPRVSPSGDLVAFGNVGSSDELLVVDRKGAVRHLATPTGYVTGLAWAPGGKEVWYSEGSTIRSASLTGVEGVVYQGITALQLEDISRDGNAIVNTENVRTEIVFIPPGHEFERELSWMNVPSLVGFSTALADLSHDGRQVLLTVLPDSQHALTYLRGTDGSPPEKLGPGQALAFSPDGQWVVVKDGRDTVSLLPVGVGSAKHLSASGLIVEHAQMLSDGKRLVLLAQRDGEHGWHLFLLPLDGGTPTPLPGALSVRTFLVSPDDRLAAGLGIDHKLTIFPLDGSPPFPLPELGEFLVPAGWTNDGQLWVADGLKAGHDSPSRLMRYDLRSRRIVEERVLSPMDRAGFAGVQHVFVTPDSRAVAYEYIRILGDLYLVKGLASAYR